MTVDRTGLAWEVMAAFDDPATATFDAVLAAAPLDEMTARALRFWQRESVHNTKQYAASAVPAVLDATARAQAEAQAATDRGTDAWRQRGRTGPVRDGAAPSVARTDGSPPPEQETPPEQGRSPAQETPPSPSASADLLETRRSAVAAQLAHLG